MPEDTEAAIGSRKRFECRVIGYPVPKITWLKDDVNITRSDRYKFDYSTDGYVTMEIQNVTYADVGSYQCLAVNSEGWASTTAHLKVKGRHVDAADDTMTIHRMTFEKSGSRDDIQDLQQVIAYQHVDFVDRSLLPEEVQPIFITKQQRGYDTDQFSLDKSENVTSSNKANIDMDADSLSALIENESGVVPKEMAVKAPSRDKDETDSGISGIFSTSSSVDHKDREDINFKEKISISVVDEDPDLESGQTFDQIDIEQIGYLKADDIFNKGRRLTGDSGIADDDFSPTSSDDETMNRKMSSDKGKRNKTDMQHNVNTDQKSSTDPAYQRRSGEGVDNQKCSANPEYQSRSGKENDSQKCPTDPEYRCQCGEGNRSSKGPNDKTTPEERAEEILKSERNKDTSTCESKESIKSTDEYEDPNDTLKSIDETRIVVDGVNDAKNNIDKITESSKEPRHGKERFQEESSLQENKSANSITIYSKQAETEEESNGQYETECKIQPGNVKTTTQNADSDGNEDVFHSDEEEHKILQEIRPNLHRHKAALDDTRSNTVSFQSEESWSVYESCDDISLSEFNFDTVSGHYLDEEDFIFTRLDSKSGKVAGLKTVREDPETDKAVENGSCCTQSRDDHDESFPEAETTIGFTNGDKDQTTKRHSSNSNKSRDNSCNEKNENNDRKPNNENTNQGKHDTALDDTVPNDATKSIPEIIICDDGTMDQGLIYNESPPHEIASNDFGATGVDSDNGRQDQFGVNDRVVSNERKDSVEDCPIGECDEHTTFKERIDEQLDKSKASKIQGQFDESNEQGNEMYNTHQTNEYVVACLSDEDENEVLREIRPHLRLNKSPVDETRSNTFSLLSGESWSVYDSEFDYTLSETNFDSISYQKLGDDDDVDFTISVDNCKVDKGIVPIFESAICNDEQSKSRERDKMENDPDIRPINREQLGESRVNYENILDLKKKLEDMLAGEEANPSQDQTNQPFEVEKGIVNSFMLSNEKKARNNNDDFSDGDRNSLPADELELERAELLPKLDLSSYVIEKKEKTDPCHVLTEKHIEAGSVIDDTRGTGSVTDDTSGKKLKSHNMDNKNDTVEQKGATDSENSQDEDDIICKQEGLTDTENGHDGDNTICEQRGVTGTKNGQGGDNVTSEQRDATYTENDQNAELRSKALLLLHTMATQDWLEEGGSVEDINETRPALPNTLHLSSDLIASVFGQLATNTGLQISSSPPDLEELDFVGFVNAETIVPVTETRASLLSPISEEGTISQTNESVEVLSPESSQNNSNSSTLSKTKRPSLIGLTITDTNGVVEHIDLDNIDDLESSPNHFYERGLDLGVGEMPRIVKGPSSVTSYDGGEIVLQWSILGSPEPEVVVFKDGDALDICDGITLEHEGTTWTLLIPDAMKEDAGLYEICAVNSSGNDILKTRVYVKTVTNFPKKEEYDCTVNSTERGEPPGVPQFIKTPKSTVAEVGQKISVQCEVSGTPVPILQWYKDGEPVEPGDRFEVIQDQSKCHLVIQPSLPEDSGIYLCTAANSVGVDQVQFTVSVSEKDEEEDETPEFSVGSEQGNDCRPSAPQMQLDMTESDECFSKRYQLVCNYHDNFNYVDVEEGEIIEVLDRSQASHWLVKSLKNKSKICYVPPDVLVDCNTGLDSTWNCYHSNRRLSKEELTAKTKEVIHELLESEADYICDLKDILDTYSESTKEGNREPVQEGEITRVNKPTSSCGVFDQLSKLYQFHKKKLLPSLLITSDNTENVGKIFTKQGDDFSNYIPFVSEHDKVTDKAESDQLQALLEAFSLLTGDPATAFEDLLNRPLERIHEYIDLLKTLIKLTAQSGGDSTGLMAAVQMLSEICRNMEDIVLLDKITGYDGDVRELGPVLKHDNVLKVTEEESEGQRHVILFPDKIMVTKPLTSDPKGKLEFEKVIELKDLSVREQDETSGCHIELWEDKTSELSASPLLKLQVQDIHTKRAWVRDIQQAQKLLECNKTIKDTMPEFTQKLKGKKLTSTPKKSKLVKSIDSVETESDRSSDDFNILGTRKDLVGDRYVAAEFEDGTTRPMFKRKLQKTIVEESTTVRLECEVSGIPQPKVLWMKNNRPLLESDHCKVITEGTTHILEFTDAKRSDTGLYTARAMNVNGSTISTAELYVGEVQPSLLNKYKEGLSDAKYQTPAYFFQMNSCQVEEGRLARFDCRVVAYPKPDIIWMKDGKIVEPNDRYQLLNFNNEIYSLLIQNVVKGDMGRYTCWAHNKYGEAMTEAYLNVIAYHDQEEEGDIAPRFLTRFYDQTLTEGVPAELQCLIDGRPIPTVKWLFNDIEIIPDDNLSILQDKNLCALYIKSVTGKDLGTYSCNLKNPLGEASCTAGLNVLSDKIKNVPVLPKFLKRIGDQNMRTGENVTFEVVVIGEPPPKVTWLYNHKPISETRRRFKMTQDGDKYTLTIEDLILDDDGKITCKAVNSEGEVYCSGNLLVRESRRTSEKPEEPKFTQKDFDAKYGYVPTFIKKIEDIYIPSGKDGKFECRVMGIPEPTVTWHRDGRPLKNDGHYLISQDNQYCYLTIRGAKELDQGVYTCTISNAAGENSCTAYMRLGDAKRPGDLSRESSVTPLSRRGTGDVPTMPYDKPTVSDIRPESVRLTWQPVLTSALSSDSRNIKYAIEGRELPDADWRKMASGIHGNTHVVRNLRPQRDYDFRVRAENKFGASDATQPASLERPRPEEEDFAESMKSKVPQYRRPPDLPKSKPLIADIGAETVKLAWQPAPVPRDLKAPPPPISYRLEAQELPSTDWLPLSSRLTDTSTYLSDLLPDRDYNIRVRAENKYGLSEPTEPIWIPRAKAFPGVPIARPEIIEMEPHSIKLRWDRVEVPSFSNDDEPLLYMIEMQEPPIRDWTPVARDIASTVYVVSDLEPGQDYRFRVRARTPRGVLSEPSPVASVYRTVASTTAPIDSLELDDEDVDFDGIRLRWNRVPIPPYSGDDEPLLYMIEMNEPPLDEWRPIISGLPTTRYRVTDLLPDRDYHFRVRALSSYGISPPSYTLPVSYRRPTPRPSRILPEYPKITYDDSDALQLSWQPLKTSTPIKEPIRYRVEMQAPPSLAWKPLATGVPDTRYPIRGLGPSRDYMFRVIPETTSGLLEPLPPVSLTSLPAPRTFLPSRPEIHDYTPDSLELSWRRPYIDSHTPLLYRIEVQEPPSVDWRPLVSDISDTRYRVSGLQPSRDYTFRVVPYHGSDYWEPLPPVSITSLPVKPRFRPHEPTITPYGDDSLKLSWQPADIPVYPRKPVPIRYIVDMRTLPRYDWTPLARNVTDTTYIVKGLSPSKEYEFRVRPQTDYGIGEPTLPVTFYRKPVPMVRREPVISNIYGDSVLLSWQPAEVRGDFRFPTSVTYSIEMQERPGIGPWLPMVTGITGTNYHVTGLHPDREYFFRVRGHVGDVFGEPSAPVYLTHRAGPPKMPHEQPYISELNPNSVHLQWRAVHLPHRITDYAPVTYRLEVQELPRSDWAILADGIPHTDFHVTNLNPDKEYNFRIRAINKYGSSEPTPLVMIRRRAVPPTMPKDEPMIYDIGHGSLMLSWRPADVPYYLGDSPVTYTIYVQESPSMTWRPLYRRIPYTSYHVTNLHPDRDYAFRVQAENMYGVSQPTNTIRLTRMSDFSSPIDIPEITEFDETRSSLMLQWKRRSQTPFDSKPVRYHIESWEPVKRTWRRMATDIPDTNYRLTGLSPENDYILRIRAEAESVLSEPSYPVSTGRFRAKVPITRPQLYDVEADSVRLSWQPYPGRTPPRRYKLEMKETSTKDWRPVTTDVYGTTHKVTGLKPKYDYEFRLRGITEQGPTDYVYSVPLYRRSVIPRLPLAGVDVVNVDDDSVDLRWRLVDIPSFSYDEKPLAYLIEAQQLPRYDWVPVASGISDTKYKVKNLQRNQDYVFRIRGEFSSGLSQPSQHISVFRRPSRPGVPIARPEIFDEDSTSARLRWHRVYTPPYHRHSEPLSYHIEVQEAPSRQWRPLARGITMTEHTLTDLLPKKDYLFRLRAETPNGDISDPTPPVAYYKSPVLSPRMPRRTIDYKVFEQDYSVPSRSYVDHLTTFIPPRLPLDKPDLTEDGPSTVLLRWKPAQVPERARERYPVTYSIEVKNPPNLDWREVEGGLTTLSHKLENIHPEVDYMFRIRAHNEFGASEATLPVSLYRPIELVNYQEDEYDSDYEVPLVTLGDCEGPIDEVPPKLPMETPRLTNIMGDRVTMHWLSARIPAYAKKVPITYIVEIKEDNMPGFSRLQSGITDTKFTIDNLNPNMSYQFRVKAETQFGCSDPTLAVVLDRNKDGEEEVSLKLDDVRNLIQSLQDKSKRVSIDSRRDDLEIPQKKIRDLVPSGVPPRMSSSRPLISNHFGGDLTLTWGSGRVPSYVKGSTITYIVERRDPPHTTWTVVADNLTENEYDVIGLNTDRDYMFRVRAKNQYGTSEPTMPCSVINVKDDYVPPVFSRSQSRDSGTPRMSRRSSLESPLSLSRQMSLTDDSEDSYRTSLPPEFKSTVEDLQYGVLGRTARINLAIRGFPLPVVTWSYKGDNLTNKNKYKSLITPSGVITLDIYNFTMEDVGEYKCTAENDHGVKGYIVQLEFADAPTFLEPSEDLYLDIHKSGKFECRVDGIPYPKVRWMKDCRYVTESSRVKVTHTKPNLWTLQLSDVISLDGGLYTCEAENMAGKSVCSARLLVDAKIFKEVETVMRPVTFRDAVFEDYYYPLEELGRGRHGVVRRVIQKSTGDEYAAKIIPTCNEELKYFFGHELNNLRRANNQRVPSVVDAFQSERQLIIVMDLIKGRSLVDYILSCDKWTEAEAVKYIKQLLEILRSIHAINVAHLDIKPSNIFMADSESDQIRLIDFGFSRLLSLDYDVKMNYGTEEFTSPEQIQNEAVSSASDMWSVGILTYILLSGVSPLKGENRVDTLKKVVECNLKLSEENFKHVSEDAKDFLAELLVVDDIDRLSAAECLQHPWIRDIASKSTEPLDIGPLKAFNDIDNAERQLSNIRSIPNLYSLQSVQDQSIQPSSLSPVQGEQSEGLVFPDSDFFGEYVDEESWYDWQNRYHRGPGSKNVALSDNDYLAKVPGLKTTRRKINMDEDDEEEKQPKKRLVVVEADKNLYEDPCLAKELQYAVVADEVRQRKPADSQSKDRSRDEDLQIISKFTDMAFTPRDNIVLRCTVDTDEPPAVTWYRNEDMVTESSRLSVKTTANSTSLTVLDIKPYDVGIYKCVIRSKGGRATAAARILVGEVPSQPSRPVASKVSSTQVLLLWEPPATDGNSNVTGYRVDYKKKSGSSWTTVDFPIDECSLVSDLVPNTSYRFRVCAVNQFGSSAYSVASPEIVTEENGEKISLDDFTAGILSRQTGYPLIPAAPSGGNVQMTEGTYEEKYKITETLYSGKFSELIKAENISTGRVFVAKVFADKMTGSKEFETLKMMNHEKIARLYDGFLFNEKLYMITEYLCGVNVLQHFAFKSKYSEDMVAIVIRQVLEGVQYLGHMGVVHLNLQPSSIVMRSRCHLNLKICGFGRAQKVHGNGEVVSCVGYPDFMAPEVITREVTTFSADMWTVAVLCFMLLSGESPFRASTVEQTYTNIVYCRYDAHGLYDNITRDALRFIYRILKRVPRNRPTVEDCLEDKWLQLADTTVKARQETVFTTAKLRRFADIYRERGILGIWQPEYIPNEESNKEPVIEDVPVKQEMTVSKPGVKEQIMEDKTDKQTEEKSDKVKEEETGTKETMSEIDTGSSDGLTGSDMKSGIDKMAENLVTAAMDEAMKDKELK